jgi:hypothetical protein
MILTHLPVRRSLLRRASTILAFCGLAAAGQAAEPTIAIETSQAAGKVSPSHGGLTTEEINHFYDGGLYGELTQNRAFIDDPQTPVHWPVVRGDGVKPSFAYTVPANGIAVLTLKSP